MLVINYDEVMEHARPRELITAIRNAFREEIHVPKRQHYDVPGGMGRTILVMPAWSNTGEFGIKIASVFPENADKARPTVQGLYILLDGQTGEPMAAIDARSLTLTRTAAVSAVAADALANPDARVLLVLGTGALVPHLVLAHTCVRKYESVWLWGRDVAKAEHLKCQLEEHDIPVSVVEDLTAALGAADVISSATGAGKPLIAGSRLKPDAHLDLVGGFKPNMREADSCCFKDARVVVDNPNAISEAGDLIVPQSEGALRASEIITLGALLKMEAVPARTAQRTIFKSVGFALSDFAAARLVCERRCGGSESLEIGGGAGPAARSAIF